MNRAKNLWQGVLRRSAPRVLHSASDSPNFNLLGLMKVISPESGFDQAQFPSSFQRIV